MLNVKKLLALFVALAALAGAFASQSRVDERQTAQARGAAAAAAGVARQKAADVLSLEIRGLEGRALAAAALPPLRNQLALLKHEKLEGQLANTIRDSLMKEPDWAPFRNEFSVFGLATEGTTIALLVGADAAVFSAASLVERARTTGIASGVVTAGKTAFAAGAARITIAALPGPAVVLLARAIDGAALKPITDRIAGAAAVSDGNALLVTQGSAEDLAHLKESLGSEKDGLRVADDGTWAAAAAPVAPGLWLWVHGSTKAEARAAQAAGSTTKMIVWSAGALIAMLALGLGFLRRTSPPASVALSETAIGRAPTHSHQALNGPRSTNTAPMDGTDSGAAFGATLHAAGAIPPPGVTGKVFGRYILLDLLGEGGMAQVFTAVVFGAEGFRRKFVVKRLRPELANDQAVVAQFIDEANMASSLVHSNIIPVLDFGRVGDEYFLATEYILGRDLGKLTARSLERDAVALPVTIVMSAVYETLKALEYSHTRTGESGQPLGIVHRDVSPSNILVSARGEVKLFDFGIVKAEGRVTRTQHGVVKGNVSFMAPEQARGLEVDARADLFSVGLVMFYCLTGEVLYQGGTSYELLVKAATGPSTEDLARIRLLPSPAAAIVTRALCTDPASRFQSAAEFAAALVPFVDQTGAELRQLVSRLCGDDFRSEEQRFAAAVPGSSLSSGTTGSQAVVGRS